MDQRIAPSVQIEAAIEAVLAGGLRDPMPSAPSDASVHSSSCSALSRTRSQSSCGEPATSGRPTPRARGMAIVRGVSRLLRARSPSRCPRSGTP